VNTIIPKIFISYSWSSTEQVVELAQRLKDDGVDVVLDKWRLSEGQDKYAFMEQCVTDESIHKVLIICDKAYAEKANKREGGVGDETMIMSAEVYGKASQEKFIPLIFECDEDGKEYTPAYLKSRIYIDFSNADVYEGSYERLLRNLYNKPEYSEPPLGKMPEWLNEESVSLSPLRATIKQLQSLDGKNAAKQRYLLKKFNDDFSTALVDLAPKDLGSLSETLLKQIDASKPLRDLFFDFVELLVYADYGAGDVLGDFFEQTYNTVYCVQGRSSYSDPEFEFGFFMIWEMFIGTTAILIHNGCYAHLHGLLTRTYFLNDSPVSANPKPCSYVRFRNGFSFIEEQIKPKTSTPNILTLVGEIASKRDKHPLISKNSIANADVILYQLSDCLDVMKEGWGYGWFPKMYIFLGNGYGGDDQQIWSRMVSKRYCEKLLPLFGVRAIEELKTAIQRNKADRDMSYKRGVSSAPNILRSIKLEDIATLP
jgi:hypothetical protein